MENLGKIRQALQDDLSRADTDTNFTLAYLDRTINMSIRYMAGLYNWQETQGGLKHSTRAGYRYVFYPENLKTDSVFFISINKKEHKIIRFVELERYRQNNPNGTKLLASDLRRKLFIHPTPTETIQGVVEILGHIIPPDLTNDNTLHVFAYQSEMEQAIFKYAQGACFMKERGSYLQKGTDKQDEAKAMAAAVWEKQKKEQAKYRNEETTMFSHIDLLNENEGGVARFRPGNFNC